MQIQSFQTYYDSLLTEALEWKELPEEIRQQGFDLIGKHNMSPDIDEGIKGCYSIDVTGRHQVYYTLWRWKEIDPMFAQFIKNPIYMGNLATDFLPSVQKALERVPKTVKLRIDADSTRQHLIGKTEMITFGKYRGRSFPEVYLENPSYFAWLAKNQDPKYAHTKTAQIIRFFSNLYFEEMTKKNQASSTAQYVGAVKDKYEGELTVYKIEEKMGRDFTTGEPKPYKVYKMTDAAQNKFVAYDIEKHFPEIREGQTIKVRARIKGQKEIVGIKFNLLNYVRPSQ